MKSQEDSAIIDILKEYIEKECPYIENLRVDYLGENKSWSLEQGATPKILKTSVLGNREMQISFTLATRIPINSLTDEYQRKVLKTFDDISEWMYSESKKGLNVVLNENEEPKSIEAVTSAYLFSVNKDRTFARYEMPGKFIYKKIKKRGE